MCQLRRAHAFLEYQIAYNNPREFWDYLLETNVELLTAVVNTNLIQSKITLSKGLGVRNNTDIFT